jgi:hypothetical protein
MDRLHPAPPPARLVNRVAIRTALLWLALLLCGCASEPQIHSSSQHQVISLQPGALLSGGVAFITPSTVTGQEEDKQALALIVAEVMHAAMPDMRCVTLAETLGLINKAGLADDYKHMYVDYRDTSIFKREALQKIGQATRARYLIQLKLASFSQGYKSRFGLFGIRMVDTSTSHIRLFFQIWDSRDGSVAWEANEEVSYAFETAKEDGTTFRRVVEEATRHIIASLPR